MSEDRRTTRRTFFEQSGGCVLAAMAGIGLAAAGLEAAPVSFVRGEANGAERRYPIPAAGAVVIDYSAQVILAHVQQRVFAFVLACPHEHAAVKWVAKDQRFQCTKHDSRYTPDGTYTSGRATRNLDRFALRLDAQAIVVDLDQVFESDKNHAAWDAAAVTVP